MTFLQFLPIIHSDLQESKFDPNEWTLKSFKIITSTNDYVKNYLGLNNKIIAMSEIQTKGRGRSNNIWYSPKGGIWLSIGFLCNIDAIELSTPIIKHINEFLLQYVNSEIKPPNDILINSKKLCGLLVETETKQNKIKKVIIGIGINTNLDPKNSSFSATSLKHITNKNIDNKKLFIMIKKKYEKLLLKANKNSFSELKKFIRKI